jgi:hypothetical protein
MGRFWVTLRLTSLLDEVGCGFVDLAVLGLIGNYGPDCFRPRADIPCRPLPPEICEKNTIA